MERLVKWLVMAGVALMVLLLAAPNVSLPYPLGKVDLPAIVTQHTPVQPVTLPLPR